jgi:hypothetical protein
MTGKHPEGKIASPVGWLYMGIEKVQPGEIQGDSQ